MKTILIVGDGMGDRPVKAFDGKTPLEVAKKPSMDKLAKMGICGIMDPLGPGRPPGSDTSHLAIFGYNPFEVYRGRGAFEALGVGLDVRRGDVAFRCNFATVDENLVVLDRRAGRIEEGGDELANSLNNLSLEDYPDIEVLFKHLTEHRCAMILRGLILSMMVSDSDPHETGLPIQPIYPLDGTPGASHTAEVLNRLTKMFHEILDKHPVNAQRKAKRLPPANAVLIRGAGELPDVHLPITSLYGIKAAVIAANALTIGVCKAVGIKAIHVPGATGTVETDILAKARAAIENLPKYDLIYIHVKGTDNASHDGNFRQKVEMIEKIDKMVGYLLDHTSPDEVIIALTADHTTPVTVREHTGDPVPVAIVGPGVRTDDVVEFSERACAKGGLGRICGIDLFPILMNLAGKARLFGA